MIIYLSTPCHQRRSLLLEELRSPTLPPWHHTSAGIKLLHAHQGSPSNGTFSWINPYNYRNSYITFMTAQCKNNFSFTCPSIDNARMRMYVHCRLLFIRVVRACHECLGLFLRFDIESLDLSSYPGNRVISKTLRESFNSSSNLANISSL